MNERKKFKKKKKFVKQTDNLFAKWNVSVKDLFKEIYYKTFKKWF